MKSLSLHELFNQIIFKSNLLQQILHRQNTKCKIQNTKWSSLTLKTEAWGLPLCKQLSYWKENGIKFYQLDYFKKKDTYILKGPLPLIKSFLNQFQ